MAVPQGLELNSCVFLYPYLQHVVRMKKVVVFAVLFILPLVAYLFFASGVNTFGRLPMLTEKVPDIQAVDSAVRLEGKITILGFLGKAVEAQRGNAFNLNQKIYKRFREFNDFQMVMVVSEEKQAQVAALRKELGQLSNAGGWHFAFGNKAAIQAFFAGLHTTLRLDEHLATPYVFIIDKERNLRGRTDDADEGRKYGFNTASVADLNNKMEDDVKVILAEYRLALKKNNHAHSSP